MGWITEAESKKAKKIIKYMTMEEQRELYKDVNANGVLIGQFILSKIGRPNYEITDQKLADGLGMSKQVAQKHRLRLEKTGWFCTIKTRNNYGDRFVKYYFGKDYIKNKLGGGDIV